MPKKYQAWFVPSAIGMSLTALSITGYLCIAVHAQETVPLLERNKAIERSLNWRERQSFRVDLAAGDFIYAIVEQRGIDVLAQLIAPDGAIVFSEDSPNGTFGPERLAFVAV